MEGDLFSEAELDQELLELKKEKKIKVEKEEKKEEKKEDENILLLKEIRDLLKESNKKA